LPNQALLLACSAFALALHHAHYESLHCSLPSTSPLHFHASMCTIGAHLPMLCLLCILIVHFVPLHILAHLPVYLSSLLFLVLCVVAVPFRVECACLKHSGLGTVRPNILPHQQCC
jgi:hypothetical protein